MNPEPRTRIATRRRTVGRRALALAAVVALIACGAPGAPNGGGGSTTGLTLSYPAPGQSLSGTVGVAAAGHGGAVADLRFELGSLGVDARADGTAYLDTRALADGTHTLRAVAVVAGEDVSDTISVVVANDVGASGTVGVAGGSLKTPDGSFATIAPGALPSSALVAVDDATQAGILNDFGVDYPALGVTFLGAMEVDTGGVDVGLPLSVDLAGWAQAVQPGQRVVMFALAPDADGDGVGELMFASEAEATDTGSVITRPTPRSEVYGFGDAGGLATQQTASLQPGQIVTVTGRGFNTLSPLSNVARYGSGNVPSAETLVDVRVADSAAFNPLLEVRFAVPALGAGSHDVALHNLTTGYRAAPTTVGVLALGTGTAATWSAFREQVAAAASALTTGRADLATHASGWLATLGAADAATFAAMATHSGLVSSTNLAALQAMEAGSLSAADADLVTRHALVLDAMAASTGGATAAAAADLASLLMVMERAEGGAAGGGVRTAQGGGGAPCSGGATTPTTGISWGAPVTTGMGSAQPGSCGAGGASGDGAGPQAMALGPEALATTSVRAGSFRPVAGALVRIFRTGTNQALAPFTAVTDASGFFNVPFLPPGEPYTVRAIDLATLQVAEASGVTAGVNVATPIQLVFGLDEGGPGAPTASLEIRPIPDDRFDGTTRFEFDAGASSDDGSIESYVWDFGGFVAEVGWTDVVQRGYGRNGTYDVRLTVIDDEGRAGTTTRQFMIDDLPHAYWGDPPERVSVGSNGEIPDAGTRYGYAVSTDGRYVTFATDATTLHPDDVNGDTDLYLKDMTTGELELISSGAAGESVGSGAGMSADARYVAYDYYPTPTSEVRVRVHDRQTGTFEDVLPESGLARASLAALSGDGRTVVFRSSTLNGPRHAYVKDLDTDEVVRLGLRLDGTTYAVDADPTAISSDGGVVLFESSDGDLVPDDTNGQRDVFVFRRDTQTTERVSVAADGTQGDQPSRTLGTAISGDGRYVAFWSDATTFPRATENDGAGVNDRADDVYVKDLATGALTLVSTNDRDVSGDDDSVLPTISGDGRYVAFGSYATNLAPEMERYDGDCALNMCNLGLSYVKDLVTGRVVVVTVGLNDTLPNDWDQIEPVLSADGRYVTYYSWATNLVTSTPASDDYYRAPNPLWAP